MENQIKKKGFRGVRQSGRTTPNKTNKEKLLLKALLEYVLDDRMDKFKQELDSLKGKDFINVFISLYKIKTNGIESIEANDKLIEIFKNKIKN